MLSIHWKIVFFFYFPLLPVRHFNEEHAHYVGLVVAYTWNREKQMFVALGKEFDMIMIMVDRSISFYVKNIHK